MRHFTLFAVLIWILPTSLFAGGEASPAGGRSAALGNASVTFVDPYAAFHNPAALAYLDGFGAAVSSERRFWVEGLDLQSLSLSMPTSIGSFALSAQYLGWSAYNEQRVSLAYARTFGEQLAIGLQFDYLGVRIPEYGSRSGFTADLGVLYEPVENWKIGAHLYNPFRTSLSEVENEEVPVIFTLGTSYALGDDLLMAFEVEKNVDERLSVQSGLEYGLTDYLWLRGGVSTEPVAGHFGLGLDVRGLNIDLAASVHQVLGVTPTMGLAYTFDKKKQSN